MKFVASDPIESVAVIVVLACDPSWLDKDICPCLSMVYGPSLPNAVRTGQFYCLRAQDHFWSSAALHKLGPSLLLPS